MICPSAAPADPTSRIELLDALRGFALFGVCVANLFSGFSYWDAPASANLPPAFTLPTDGAAIFLMHALVEGKFYSIFSLLFGLGFALQLERGAEGSTDPIPRFRRRLRVLMVIGLGHILLLWTGDILLLYGLMGLVLLRMRDMDDRRLLWWAIACVFLPIVSYAPTLVHQYVTPALPFWFVGGSLEQLLHLDLEKPEATVLMTRNGTLVQWLQMHFAGLWWRFADLVFVGRPFKVLAMFLLGLLIGRHRMWSRLDEYAPLLRRVAIYGALVGLPASVAWTLFKDSDSYYGGTWHGLAESALYSCAVAPLALSYAAVFALLWRAPRAQRVLRLLVPPGQMALTNYLSQTVFATIAFTTWGFQLVGRIGPTWLWLWAVVTIVLQMAISTWWLSRFRFGPMEWVWRSLTYRAAQPMTRRAPAPASLAA